MKNPVGLAEAEKATAKDLLNIWGAVCESAPRLKEPTEIVVVETARAYGPSSRWIERDRVGYDAGVQRLRLGVHDQQERAGPLYTIAHLVQAGASADEHALVWIAATLHPLAVHPPEPWYGDPFQIAHMILGKTGRSYPTSVKYTLPTELPSFLVRVPPQNLWEYISLAAVQAAFVLANFAPAVVRIVDGAM